MCSAWNSSNAATVNKWINKASWWWILLCLSVNNVFFQALFPSSHHLLSHSQIIKMHSFLDYIMGGCQIQFTVSPENKNPWPYHTHMVLLSRLFTRSSFFIIKFSSRPSGTMTLVFVLVLRGLCTHSYTHTQLRSNYCYTSESRPLADHFLPAADLSGANVSIREKFLIRVLVLHNALCLLLLIHLKFFWSHNFHTTGFYTALSLWLGLISHVCAKPLA